MKKTPLSSKKSSDGDKNDDFSFKNIMGMMMMQKNADQEEHAAFCEEHQYQLQHEKIDCEFRVEQAQEDRLQQQMQMQQMMTVMMMAMMNSGKRMACGGSSDNEVEVINGYKSLKKPQGNRKQEEDQEEKDNDDNN